MEDLRKTYPGRELFLKSKAEFSENELVIAGHQIIQRWETDYMKELARIASLNGGDILEIGFGLGISANFIEENNIKSHTIIEAHPEVCKFAKNLVAKYPEKNIKIIEGFWEDKIHSFKDQPFDGILFDTYPLEKHEEHRNHIPFFPEAYRLLRNNGVFTYYSDEHKTISGEHLELLKKAGFIDIKWELCKVQPYDHTDYWEYAEILIPIVKKKSV